MFPLLSKMALSLTVTNEGRAYFVSFQFAIVDTFVRQTAGQLFFFFAVN